MNSVVTKQVSYSMFMAKVSKKGISSLYLPNVLQDYVLNVSNNKLFSYSAGEKHMQY